MKFKFKIQGYQTDAVDNTTAIFTGQPNRDTTHYRRDLGRLQKGTFRFDGDDDGYRNADVELSSKQLLENLHSVQTTAGVPLPNLFRELMASVPSTSMSKWKPARKDLRLYQDDV